MSNTDEIQLNLTPRARRITGTIAGSLLVLLFLFGYMKYTVLSLGCRLFQLAIVISFVANFFTTPVVHTKADISSRLEKVFEFIEPKLSQVILFGLDIISWKQPVLTLSAFVASFAVGFLAYIMHDLTTILVSSLIVLAWHPIYAKYHVTIDQYFSRYFAPLKNQLSWLSLKASALANKDDSGSGSQRQSENAGKPFDSKSQLQPTQLQSANEQAQILTKESPSGSKKRNISKHLESASGNASSSR